MITTVLMESEIILRKVLTGIHDLYLKFGSTDLYSYKLLTGIATFPSPYYSYLSNNWKQYFFLLYFVFIFKEYELNHFN